MDEQQRKKLENVIQKIIGEEAKIPFPERVAFLNQTREKLEADRDKWISKKRELEQSLKGFENLNDRAVDQAMENYLEKGSGYVENEALAAKPIQKKPDHLEVTIHKFRRLVEVSEKAIAFCKVEANRISKKLNDQGAEEATDAAISAIDAFCKVHKKAEDLFDVMLEKVRQVYNLDQSWSSRAQKRGSFYGVAAGLGLLRPAMLEKASMDKVVSTLRRQRVEGNPFVRPDGQERNIKDRPSDMFKREFHPDKFGTERPAFEQALNDLAQQVVNQ